jgi:hypothetical protein
MSSPLSLAEILEEIEEPLIAAREIQLFIQQRPLLKISRQFPLNYQLSNTSQIVSTHFLPAGNSRCFHFRPYHCHGLLYHHSHRL